MRGRRTKRNILMISLVAALFLMGIGYAAFQTNLTIKGTGTVVGKWDIEITGVEELDPIGHAESASTPTYSALTANMEANLYDKGAAMEYEVTIENKGNIDATLDEIQQSEVSNDAVKISVTGYTKGEVLAKQSSKKVKVKIEYDENYDGEAEDGTSASLEVTFVFGQAETASPVSGGTPTTVNKYKLSFDCKTNGSSSCSSNDEYYKEGDEVDLTTKNPTSKKGYTFKGWGEASDATSYITSYTMTDADKTLFAIYEAKEGPSITNVSTTSTTNSITVVTTATGEGLTYEYSKDGGDNWTSSTDSNTYTFDNLKQNTEYEIYVRVTNENEGTTYSDKYTVTTKTLDTPSLVLKYDKIKIIYPEVEKDDGTKLTCASGLTCTYSKNGLDFETTTNTITKISFKEYGTLVAKATDGTNTVSNSYTVSEITQGVSNKLAEYSTLSSTTLYTTYKTSITKIYTVDHNTVPEDAVASWDVSETEDESVIAWVIDDPSNIGKYKLYIGSQNGIIANEDSSDLFNGFTSATTMSLAALDTSSVTNMDNMFANCTNLTTIYSSESFVTTNVTTSTDMFVNDTNLVGGNETTYDSTKTDVEYAVVDKESTPGYFTDGSIPIIDNVSTTSATSSITVVVSASVEKPYSITKIEFSKDDGSTYVEGNLTDNNDNTYTSTYTFIGLTHNTGYQIKVKITSNTGKIVEKEIGLSKTTNELKESVVTSGDGLYQDTAETDRYIYKGIDPDNYIIFNNETWRIYSIENDGSIKIVKDERLDDLSSHTSPNQLPFDLGRDTPAITGVKKATTSVGTRYSSSSTDYCYQNSGSLDAYFGCNAWGNKYTTLSSSGNNVTAQSRTAGATSTTYTLPESESYINVYLNHQFNSATYKGWVSGTTYEEKTLPSYYSIDSSYTPYIKTAIWNMASPGALNSSEALNTVVNYEKYYKWSGKVGLLTASEYIRANTNTASCGLLSTLKNNQTVCKETNYLYKPYDYWLLSAYNNVGYGMSVSSEGGFSATLLRTKGGGVRPVVYLNPSVILGGYGSKTQKYEINKKTIITDVIETPTYTQEATNDGIDTIITFNNDCSKFKCEYSIDNGSTWSESSSDTKTISLTENGTYQIVGKVTDKDNSSNVVTISTYAVVLSNPANSLKSLAVTSGDGLYQDATETDRYIYKGADPNNYITFNNEIWRIYSIENDGSIKIVKDEKLKNISGYVPVNPSLAAMVFDPGYNTAAISGVKTASSVVGTRYSSSNADYCYASSESSYMGCNAWGSKYTTLDSNGNNVTAQSKTAGATSTTYTLPEGESLLNVYLNHQFNSATYKGWVSGTTYNTKNLPSYYSINNGSTPYIKSAIWNIGPLDWKVNSLNTIVDYEKNYKWSGKVGLLTASEYIRANNDPSNCGNTGTMISIPTTCAATNYLFKSNETSFFISPFAGVYAEIAAEYTGRINFGTAYNYYAVHPVVYLCSGLTLRGLGTSQIPYTISGSCSS